MKILVFYVDKQYFNMVILFLRLRVRRELIIRRDGRAVEGTGLENRRPERVLEFESLRFRQIQKNPAIEISRDFFCLHCGILLSGPGLVTAPAHHRLSVTCAIQQRLYLHPAIIDFFLPGFSPAVYNLQNLYARISAGISSAR